VWMAGDEKALFVAIGRPARTKHQQGNKNKDVVGNTARAHAFVDARKGQVEDKMDDVKDAKHNRASKRPFLE
jgi:hypothetical protein